MGIPKFKSVTVEVICKKLLNPKCDAKYDVTTSDIKKGHLSCDCDYPCGCPNGDYLYIEHTCPTCGMNDRTIIWKNYYSEE